jgi:hypothetical protein
MWIRKMREQKTGFRSPVKNLTVIENQKWHKVLISSCFLCFFFFLSQVSEEHRYSHPGKEEGAER